MNKQQIEYEQTLLHTDISLALYRSSRLQVFPEIGVLENLAKLTGQHFCRGPFLNKVGGFQPATLLKRRL